MDKTDPERQVLTGWRKRAHEIIYESDTPSGKAFDIALIVLIVLSVVTVVLESMAEVRAQHGVSLRALEWGITVLFTAEYVLRIICVARPWHYMRSFFGLVDLFSILPTFLSLVIPSARFMTVIRALRVLRVFRVLKLATYMAELEILMQALRASSRKILVFIYAVLTLVVILGSMMYLIEGPESGFTSIPRGIYWAIVTLTTVGYGDISPQTNLGQAFASLVMVLGYGIIAVPTGIVTAELTNAGRPRPIGSACSGCGGQGHLDDASYCRFCGVELGDKD
ncbi:MAG: voltage-gated potassium channel [Planctomycetota bacterium]|jgi:voltage-gated potassium channel